MNKPFNKLDNAEAERLAFLMEECGEVVHIIGKILRHGYESRHPSGGESNRILLHNELGDMKHAMDRMISAGDLVRSIIEEAAECKAERVSEFLHHQKGINMTDIVERLRLGITDGNNIRRYVTDIHTEAADEITRLREANKELYDALLAAVSSGMVPKSSAKEGGASAYSEQVRVADMIRTVLSKHGGELKAVKYGCHLEIDPDQEPDECVMDIGDNCGCAFAGALSREGKDKTHCEFWKPIKGEQK